MSDVVDQGERAVLEGHCAALRALCPDPLPMPGMICSCSDCIDADDLRRLDGAGIEQVDTHLAGAYFGAAGAVRRDDDAREFGYEGRFFFVKLFEALAASVLNPDDSSTILRDIWYVEPEYWQDRLLGSRFTDALSPSERQRIEDALLDLCWIALRRGSARMWDCLQHLGGYSDGIPEFVRVLRRTPLRGQIRLWGLCFGDRLHTPAGKAGTGWIDLRDHPLLLNPGQVALLSEAFCDPRIGRALALAAQGVRDPDRAEIALRAYVFWDNSVASMSMPRP